jgi:hypothetical protein
VDDEVRRRLKGEETDEGEPEEESPASSLSESVTSMDSRGVSALRFLGGKKKLGSNSSNGKKGRVVVERSNLAGLLQYVSDEATGRLASRGHRFRDKDKCTPIESIVQI